MTFAGIQRQNQPEVAIPQKEVFDRTELNILPSNLRKVY